MRYNYDGRPKKRRTKFLGLMILLVMLGLAGGFYFLKKNTKITSFLPLSNKVQYDVSLNEYEVEQIKKAIDSKAIKIEKDTSAKATYKLARAESDSVLSILVPVTNYYSVKQKITTAELASETVYVPTGTTNDAKKAIALTLSINEANIQEISDPENNLRDGQIAFVPINELSYKLKLLTFNDGYYLDSFDKGALFRLVEFSAPNSIDYAGLNIVELLSKEKVFKVNMTGVTALTRRMIRKLNTVNDATYFSQKIGTFLADADLTHVSNEVSFQAGCQYNNAVFCSPPAMIEALKASGVDVVELTGNHNNDVGSQYNTETINLYKSLGWGTFGGGLNNEEASKPFLSDQEGTKLALLGYNYPDSPNGGAISGLAKAGANSFDFDKIQADIAAAKQTSQYVIVDIQFWECYAYPNGFVEFPECDSPITNQAEVFKKVVDLGADMVVGSSAHQPQTFELYKDKPIYYGLGNLYFEQIEWPGTERGIILTHYLNNGKLLQTKLTPTVYDNDLQTRVMTDSEAEKLLTRLDSAR